MTSAQISGLGLFALLMVVIALAMMPTSRRLDGRQKYGHSRRPWSDDDPKLNDRPSTSPILAAFAIFFGHGENHTHGSDGAHNDLSDGGHGHDGGGHDGADGGR